MKNFYACNNFFRSLIKGHVVALVMHTAGCKTISAFDIWLLQLDWLAFIQEMDILYLPFTIKSIQAKAE